MLCGAAACLTSTLMAIHANRCVIRVSTHSIVMGIRTRLVRVWRIARMASIDTGEDRVIRRIDMAVAATRTVMRNLERRMVENRAEPCRSHPSGVATYASRRIIRRDVVRHVGPIGLRIREIRLMAAVAIRGWIARCVVATDVAVRAGIHHRPNRAGNRGAWRKHVRPLQWKTCRRMVELSVRPQHRVMTGGAHGSRKARGNVIGNTSAIRRRAIPRCLMAPVAIRVRRSERIVVVDVAVRAGVHFARRGQLVRTGEWPAGRGVVKRRRQKRDRVVTVCAVRRREWSARRRVHRVGGPLPAPSVVRTQVALRVSAIGRLNRQGRIIAHVALIAARNFSCRRNLVRIRQRETRVGVIEG